MEELLDIAFSYGVGVTFLVDLDPAYEIGDVTAIVFDGFRLYLCF